MCDTMKPRRDEWELECVWERGGESERETERDRERQRENMSQESRNLPSLSSQDSLKFYEKILRWLSLSKFAYVS